MITQEQCQRVASCLGLFTPASEKDWAALHDLIYSMYYDINTLHTKSTITWEITSMMQYQFELSLDQLQMSVCTEFITELYNSYFYIEGIIQYVPDKGDAVAYRIVLHALRCVILFFEHQMHLESPKEYENFKKYMHI